MKAKQEPESTNKYSVGKYLRKKKNLRKKDSSFVRPEKDPELEAYLDFLKSNGAIMNKVDIGRFKIHNGLEYTGVYATEDIDSDSILMEVPRKLLLTTYHAWFSELKPIFKQYPDYYSPYKTSSWEDHMLLTYILCEYGRGQESEWYYLIKMLPREIDYVIFWSDEELELLEDRSLVRLAKKTRKDFEEEAKALLDIAEKHPDILKKEFFTYENIKWIYIHLTTRCFGKYFEHVTMVPMAELFNHECTDVYYDFRYNEGNPARPKDHKFDDPKKITQEEMDEFESSDGSYDSVEQDEDSDFEYEKDGDTGPIYKKAQIPQDDDSEEIFDTIKEIRKFFVTKLNWVDSMTLSYIKEVSFYLDDLEKSFSQGKLSVKDAKKALEEIEADNTLFKNSMWKYYKEDLGMEDGDIKLQQFETFKRGLKKEEKLPKELFDEDKEWKKDKFDAFVMKASWKDQFEKESQVFFCYGRLSNRLMLLRYGIALEFNKYDHVHFKLPYFEYLNGNTWLLGEIKSYQVPKVKKFKLRRRKFEYDLLNFYKSVNWKYKAHSIDDLFNPKNAHLELQALKMMKNLLEESLKKCKKSEEELEATLRDPKVGYHEYFAEVLNLERQRCLRFHYKAVVVLIEIVQRLKNGVKFEAALERVPEFEKEAEYHRNRVFFYDYTSRMKEYFA